MTPSSADQEKHKQFRLSMPQKRTLSAKDQAARTIPQSLRDALNERRKQREEKA